MAVSGIGISCGERSSGRRIRTRSSGRPRTPGKTIAFSQRPRARQTARVVLFQRAGRHSRSKRRNRAMPASASSARAARNSANQASIGCGASARNAAAPVSSGAVTCIKPGAHRECGAEQRRGVAVCRQRRGGALDRSHLGGVGPGEPAPQLEGVAGRLEDRSALDDRRGAVHPEAHSFDHRGEMPGIDRALVAGGVTADRLEPGAPQPGR